jgi:asparagine synthase (glutamine-hydrolysing)
MCGIVGAVAREAGALPSPEVADRMCGAIRHRGPDDQGIAFRGRALLGMRRLSIIDLAGGHQPIHNEDETVWLVFNGEIYNFHELRADLEARGHRFYTLSDSECIVHAYEEYGEAAFARLRGMFAIALWDEKTETLVLARDRFGKKPLHYALESGGIVFGSEIKSLLETGVPSRTLEPEAVRDYLALGYVPSPSTIFRDVKKLPAGHFLVFRNGAARVETYWELPFEPKWRESEAALEERLLAELDEAVRVRLVSDVPFGAFLSGGLDSSVVVSLMARHMSQPVKTFTIGFEEKAFSEAEDARLVARHVGADHHELVVRPDAARLVEDLVYYYDEPFGDSSLIPTYLVSKLAARHVKMALSGDGGDEVFAGYTRYWKYRGVERVADVPLAPTGLAALGRVLPGRLGRRAAWLGERARMAYPDAYLSGVGLMGPALVHDLLGIARNGHGIYDRVRGHFLREDVQGSLDRVIAGDMKTYLTDDVLAKVDRATMANSLESRAPLLDHKLVEFAARLPQDLKLRGRTGKHLLRSVARRLLPAACLDKPKQGFAIPLARWFRSDLATLMGDTLESRSFRERGIFDPGIARACYDAHLAGRADHGEHLWLILTFELWARRFLS